MRGLRRLLPALVVAGLALGAGTAAAQSIAFLGVRGSSCTTIPPGGGTHTLTLTTAVAAGTELFVVVGAGQNMPLADPLSDNQGNSYPGEAAAFSDPIITKTWGTNVTHPLAVGNTIAIVYNDNSSGGSVASCALALAFSNTSNVVVSANGNSSFGSTSTSLSTGEVNTSGDEADELVFAVFLTGSATGGLSGFSPFSSIAPLCSGGLCLNPFYRVVSSTGTYQATATSANAVKWGGSITAHRDGPVFSDGFDTGDLSRWSSHT